MGLHTILSFLQNVPYHVHINGKGASRPVTKVWDCVYNLPLCFWWHKMDIVDAKFHVYCDQSRYFKPKHHLFLTLTKWFLCLNLTRQMKKKCNMETSVQLWKWPDNKSRGLTNLQLYIISTRSLAFQIRLQCSTCATLLYSMWTHFILAAQVFM